MNYFRILKLLVKKDGSMAAVGSGVDGVGLGSWVTPMGLLEPNEGTDAGVYFDPASGLLDPDAAMRLGAFPQDTEVAVDEVRDLLAEGITIEPVPRGEDCTLQPVETTVDETLKGLRLLKCFLSGSKAAYLVLRKAALLFPKSVTDAFSIGKPPSRDWFADYDFVDWTSTNPKRYAIDFKRLVAEKIYSDSVEQVDRHGFRHFYVGEAFLTGELGQVNFKILKKGKGKTAFTLADSFWIDREGRVRCMLPLCDYEHEKAWQALFDLVNGIARPAYTEILGETLEGDTVCAEGMLPVEGFQRYLLEFTRGRQCPDRPFIDRLRTEATRELALELAAGRFWQYLTENKGAPAAGDHLLSMLFQFADQLEESDERTRLWAGLREIDMHGALSEELQPIAEALQAYPELGEPISGLLMLKASQTECPVQPFHFDRTTRRYVLGRVIFPVQGDLEEAMGRLTKLHGLSPGAADAFAEVWCSLDLDWDAAPDVETSSLRAAQDATRAAGLPEVEFVFAWWRPDSSLEGIIADLIGQVNLRPYLSKFLERWPIASTNPKKIKDCASWVIYLLKSGNKSLAGRAVTLWRRVPGSQRINGKGEQVITTLCEYWPERAIPQIQYYLSSSRQENKAKALLSWCDKMQQSTNDWKTISEDLATFLLWQVAANMEGKGDARKQLRGHYYGLLQVVCRRFPLAGSKEIMEAATAGRLTGNELVDYCKLVREACKEQPLDRFEVRDYLVRALDAGGDDSQDSRLCRYRLSEETRWSTRIPLFNQLEPRPYAELDIEDLEKIFGPTGATMNDLRQFVNRDHLGALGEDEVRVWNALLLRNNPGATVMALAELIRLGDVPRVSKQKIHSALAFLQKQSLGSQMAREAICLWLLAQLSHQEVEIEFRLWEGEKDWLVVSYLQRQVEANLGRNVDHLSLYLAHAPVVLAGSEWEPITTELADRCSHDLAVKPYQLLELIDRSRALGIYPAIHGIVGRLAKNGNFKTLEQVLSGYSLEVYEADRRARVEADFLPLWFEAVELGAKYPSFLDLDCVVMAEPDVVMYVLAKVQRVLLNLSPSNEHFWSLEEFYPALRVSLLEQFNIFFDEEISKSNLLLLCRALLKVANATGPGSWYESVFLQLYCLNMLPPWHIPDAEALLAARGDQFRFMRKEGICIWTLPNLGAGGSTGVVYASGSDNSYFYFMASRLFATKWGSSDSAELFDEVRACLVDEGLSEEIVEEIIKIAVERFAQQYESIGHFEFSEVMLPFIQSGTPAQHADEHESWCAIS